MTMNPFEYLGNNRYFKYRYAQVTPINMSTIAETWDLKRAGTSYKIMEEYVKRSFNIKACYEEHKVSFFDLTKIYTEPDAFNKSNLIMFSAPLSYFHGRQEYFTPSPVFEMARIIIVSAAPKRVLSTSLSFLNMDTPVVILMGLTLVLLSLLLVVHSVVTNKYKSVSTKKVVKKLAQETLENVWDNASLLCAEPIASILPHITCRLLAASWLIGVTFVLFFLGCYLRTEFTAESYNRIDTLSDLIKSGIAPTMIQETGTLDYLKILAKQDPVVKEWLDALNKDKIFTNPVEYLTLDGFFPLLSGEKALITKDTFMTWFFGQFLTSDPENKEFILSNGGLYFSEQEVASEYLHLMFNTSWMKSSPIVHETIQLIMEPLFETRALDYLDFEMRHLIEQVSWRTPLKSAADLDLSSVSVPFYLLLMLLSGTVAVVTTKIFFKGFA